MNEFLEPDWIKRRKSQTKLVEVKGQTTTQRAIVVSLRIKAEGPEFWRQFLMELTINTNALPGIGARGRISTFCDSPKKEQRCFVEVAQKGSVVGMTSTDLFYTPGESRIRCRAEDEESNFDFCILKDGKLAVMSDDEFAVLSPKEMAEMIVEQCLDSLGDTE